MGGALHYAAVRKTVALEIDSRKISVAVKGLSIPKIELEDRRLKYWLSMIEVPLLRAASTDVTIHHKIVKSCE
ncbi:hypothetical protein AVEN_238236-1 [Araneus ventricosus]|uniref:Uncharacterized protein n=1 Tax=Araneus ventricosus TaxID=182803 RepID=A0A4Y2PKA5_ARAVE|nr:hypothetical protein AVEN_238236-1 [Araneus ventricosus]